MDFKELITGVKQFSTVIRLSRANLGGATARWYRPIKSAYKSKMWSLVNKLLYVVCTMSDSC